MDQRSDIGSIIGVVLATITGTLLAVAYLTGAPEDIRDACRTVFAVLVILLPYRLGFNELKRRIDRVAEKASGAWDAGYAAGVSRRGPEPGQGRNVRPVN